MMTNLILAHIQVENCLKLLADNPYENYLCGKLYGVKYELERQISNHSNCNADAQSPIAENKNATKTQISG